MTNSGDKDQERVNFMNLSEAKYVPSALGLTFVFLDLGLSV